MLQSGALCPQESCSGRNNGANAQRIGCFEARNVFKSRFPLSVSLTGGGGGLFPLWPPRSCHNTHFWEFCAHASAPFIYYTLTTLGHPWESIWPPNDTQETGQIVLWIKGAPTWWQKLPWWHQNDPRMLPQVHQMTPKTSQMTSNVSPITPKSVLRPCGEHENTATRNSQSFQHSWNL